MDISSLLCHEILSEEEEEEEVQQENGGGGDDDSDDDNNNNAGDNDDEMNYPQVLIGKELDRSGLNDQQVSRMVNDTWAQEVRSHAIHYILRTGEGFRFREHTAYTSVIYLDRFLGRQRIEIGEYWAVRLITMACLSLSAKLNETRGSFPSLSQYPLTKYNINTRDIIRMEFVVLGELNWNMSCVTPFDFTTYFVSRFCRQVSTRHFTIMTTVKIIMSVLRDVSLMHHRPSVIAAAATLVAINRNLTREELEIHINALPLNGYIQIDDVCYCYYKLLELN